VQFYLEFTWRSRGAEVVSEYPAFGHETRPRHADRLLRRQLTLGLECPGLTVSPRGTPGIRAATSRPYVLPRVTDYGPGPGLSLIEIGDPKYIAVVGDDRALTHLTKFARLTRAPLIDAEYP